MQYFVYVMQQRIWFVKATVMFGLMVLYTAAEAGRPMEVDDAGIVGPGACELEAWSEHRRHSNSYWAVPACNLTGNLEIGLGGALDDVRGGTGKAVVLEGKSMLAENLAGHTSVALSLEVERYRLHGDSSNEWAANLPVTTFFADERLAWHNNIGTAYDEDDKHYAFTWGTGVEFALNEKVTLYGEVFGDSTERPFFQLSSGYWVKPEQFELTLGVGDKLESDRHERWLSVGINLEHDFF